MFEFNFGFVTIVLTSASLLIQIFALVTPYWMYAPPVTEHTEVKFLGLWLFCATEDIKKGEEHICRPVNTITDYMQFTRAAEIFGMGLIAIAATCGFLKHNVLKNQDKLLKVGGTCGTAAGALMFAGVFSLIMSVTEEGRLLSGLKFHASFGLCVTAGFIAFAAGIIFFIWDRKDSVRAVQLGAPTVEPQVSFGTVTVPVDSGDGQS